MFPGSSDRNIGQGRALAPMFNCLCLICTTCHDPDRMLAIYACLTLEIARQQLHEKSSLETTQAHRSAC